ncbi:MAG: 3-phosphoshikimate 1-carboxyvinyltransferase [Clostridia bacterium]|nr:3-phosphoshikimate 1-carboxyvinyltransferase [Clostridia bacterium]
MKVKITPARAVGKITAPPSKSMAHRLLICAALAEGRSVIHGISTCEDVLATLDCMAALGIKAERVGDDCIVHGSKITSHAPGALLRCRESGSTLRFLLPVALISGRTVMLTGAKGLMQRPLSVYEELCSARSLLFVRDGESITVKGPLTSGEYSVVGNISSQFISGLLFALPCLQGDSRIRIIPPIESLSYINMTIAALAEFGIKCHWENDYTIYVPGNQSYIPRELTVEGDYSGAAFPAALNLFGGEVEISGLNPESIQGDRVYKKHFELLSSGVPTIHIGDCPDLGPILFAVAAAKCGGVFGGTKRLKIKESDRALAMASELRKFGTRVTVYEDKVVVYPADFHKPTEPLSAHNDHRIVMSLAVLLTLTGGEIEGAEAIAKSYPEFFNHLRALGVGVTEYDA